MQNVGRLQGVAAIREREREQTRTKQGASLYPQAPFHSYRGFSPVKKVGED